MRLEQLIKIKKMLLKKTNISHKININLLIGEYFRRKLKTRKRFYGFWRNKNRA